MIDTLTAERLSQALHYDPATGVFTRLTGGGGQMAGNRAGGVCKRHGYRLICIDYVKYRANRLAFLYMTGEWPPVWVDHRDGDRANDAWENLRAATASQNIANSRLSKANTSGFKGVYWCKMRQMWRATITVNRKVSVVGYSDDPEEAHRLYLGAARAAFGEFARAS